MVTAFAILAMFSFCSSKTFNMKRQTRLAYYAMQLFQSSKSSAWNKSLSSSTSVHKINDNIALKKKKHYPSPAVPEQYKVETHLCADTSPRMRKARPRRIMILQTMIQNFICNNNYVQFYPNMVWLIPRYHTLIILCCSNARLDVQIFARGRFCLWIFEGRVELFSKLSCLQNSPA